jgi:hypothetical protein
MHGQVGGSLSLLTTADHPPSDHPGSNFEIGAGIDWAITVLTKQGIAFRNRIIAAIGITEIIEM